MSFLSPITRINSAYECAWMENKCLLFQSAVQSKFLTQEMVLAYLSRSLCVTTDSLPTQNDVDIT